MRATNYSFISSFDYDFLHRFKRYEEDMLTPPQHRSKIVYLATREKDSEMPGDAETAKWEQGCNIQIWAATKDVVSAFHKRKQMVSVWVDKEITKDEGKATWEAIMDQGVDMLCTDHPLEARQVRDNRQLLVNSN
jgi:glycerophosphoryl diester phosphodiesterase